MKMGMKINDPEKEGISFGLTGGIITAIGLMVGLKIGTDSVLAVIGGLMTIAVADAFSDSLAMHMSEETQVKFSNKKIWESSISTFLSKFFFTLTFIIPFLIFNLSTGLIVSVVYGLVLLSLLSIYIAKRRKENILVAVISHILIALLVIALSYLVGRLVNLYFI